MRAWPATLFGRVALVVCGGLAIAHALTYWILQREREDAGLSMMGAYAGRDVASALAILDRVPAAERADWLPRLARRHYHYTLGAPAATPAATGAWATGLAAVVGAEVGAGRVGAPLSAPGDAIDVPVRLADGGTVTLRATPPRAGVSTASTVLLLLQFVALAAAAWVAVRLAVRPLHRLAAAADALVPGQGPAPPDGSAPREVQRALAAFDAMHRRIEAHLAERLELLAAISHDLQSPLARLSLRAELVADPALRDKLLADVAGMQALVEEGLAYARTAHASREAPRAVDVGALLDGIVCDAVDAGHAATLHGAPGTPLVTRVLALRRIVTNLVDNAVKFGGAAEVVVTDGDDLVIAVRDRGPGIPDASLDAVLQPFHRLEGSRSRDTGGTGLGLAIAHQLSIALGGRLVLANRDGGGLEARLVLPRHPA